MQDVPVPPRQRVLVLDAHTGSRWVLCYALSIRGHACEPAPSLADALAVLETFDADVIIFDWHREHPDLRAVVARLRCASRARGREARLIALSVVAEPASARGGEGVDAYLVKPVDIDTILRAIHDCAR